MAETETEKKLMAVQKQKELLEHEFGLKRAKFKSMYLECECKLFIPAIYNIFSTEHIVVGFLQNLQILLQVD